MIEPTGALELFYSYAHKDEKLRNELEKHLFHLKRQGLIIGWYDRDVSAGAEWAYEIDSHLNSAHIILLLISTDFIASEYCYSIEMIRTMERHEAGEARVIPIILRPTDWKSLPFSKLQALPTNGKPVMKWPSRDEALLDVARGIKEAIKKLPPPVQKQVEIASNPGIVPPLSLALEEGQKQDTNRAPVWNVPYRRNPFFTGREELLTQLHNHLSTTKATTLTQTQALSGLGGIGKTQTAVEYAYRYSAAYQAILWVRATSRETLISDFVTLAGLLHLPEKDSQDQTITVAAVKHWLADHQGWLLIFDNADDLQLVADFFPTGEHGHILLTTRAHTAGGMAQSLDVTKMDLAEGTLLLLRRAKVLATDEQLEQTSQEDRSTAQAIVLVMDGLPLALDQAGAYIEETRCSLSDYLAFYGTHRKALLQRQSMVPSAHPEPVATTWSLSFEQVEQHSPAATELLRFCAFLDADAIPEEIIPAGASQLGPLLEPMATDPFQLNEAIALLQRYSLVRRSAATKTLNIHRLVQAVLKDSLEEQTQLTWAERTIRAVKQAFPDVTEVSAWPQCERYLPHALACAELIRHYGLELPEAAHLLNKTAYYLDDRALYEQAEPLYQRALFIREKQLGPEHPDTATSLNNLALLYQNQGNYTAAAPLLKRALVIREQQLGPEHPDTAESLNNLAMLYRNQGNYAAAEPLYERALSISKKQLGPGHPHTATSLNNLATLYWTQGKYAAAEPLLKRALFIREKQLGSGHPHTAESLNNLASLYQDQGKYAEAEPLLKQALVIREQQLGSEHPQTTDSLNNLAMLYGHQSNYEEAAPLLKRALSISEKQLGPEHPHTATVRANYAGLLRRMKDKGKNSTRRPEQIARERNKRK